MINSWAATGNVGAVLGGATEIGRRLQRVGGWQRPLAAFGFGALSASAFAPLYFWPGYILGFTALIWLLDSARLARAPHRAAFFTGWAFGFGFFFAGMYWLAFAFLVQAEQFAWMIPIAVPGLMAFLGLYVALAAWIASFRPQDGFARIIVFVVAFSIAEWARGHLFTGLPWNLPAQIFAGSALMSQPLAVLGPYGFSVLVLLAAATPAACLFVDKSQRPTATPLLASSVLVASIVLFGVVRLAAHPTQFRHDVSVAVLQPNVPQRDKMDPRKNDQHFRALLAETARALPADHESYAIWPENAYPFLSQAEDAPSYFAELFPAAAHIISGTYRSWEDDAGTMRYGNSAVVFGQTAAGEKPVAAVYDKHHLVPFGEYLPFKDVLRMLRLSQLAPVEDGFSPGDGPATYSVGSARFSPLICYEDVFPRQLYPRGNRPEWLIVMTNDAWFGDNAGPKQHLDISRMRAIESGLPMARSANTGISAIFDGYGRTIAEVPLYNFGAITQRLPQPAPETVFDRVGDAIFVAILLSLHALSFHLRVARSG